VQTRSAGLQSCPTNFLKFRNSKLAAAFRLPHDGDLKVASMSTGQRGSLKPYQLSLNEYFMDYWRWPRSSR